MSPSVPPPWHETAAAPWDHDSGLMVLIEASAATSPVRSPEAPCGHMTLFNSCPAQGDFPTPWLMQGCRTGSEQSRSGNCPWAPSYRPCPAGLALSLGKTVMGASYLPISRIQSPVLSRECSRVERTSVVSREHRSVRPLCPRESMTFLCHEGAPGSQHLCQDRWYM